jgi:hypothetical protein
VSISEERKDLKSGAKRKGDKESVAVLVERWRRMKGSIYIKTNILLLLLPLLCRGAWRVSTCR